MPESPLCPHNRTLESGCPFFTWLRLLAPQEQTTLSGRTPPRNRLSRRQSRIGCADSRTTPREAEPPPAASRAPEWTLKPGWRPKRLRPAPTPRPEAVSAGARGRRDCAIHRARHGRPRPRPRRTSNGSNRIAALGRTVGPDSEADRQSTATAACRYL